MKQTLRTWTRGLIGAAINSIGSAITVVIVDPGNFRPDEGGATKLLTVMLVSALFGAGLYLKQHPLPVEDE